MNSKVVKSMLVSWFTDFKVPHSKKELAFSLYWPKLWDLSRRIKKNANFYWL